MDIVRRTKRWIVRLIRRLFSYEFHALLRGYLKLFPASFLFKHIEFPIFYYEGSTIVNRKNIIFGKNITICHNSFISPLSLSVGDDCWLGVNCFICGKVTIGNNVLIGPNVSIPGSSHDIDDLSVPIRLAGATMIGTVIDDDVWIGSNVTILDGVHIHTGAVIAAGSVVTKDVGAYEVVAGVPARFIRSRRE